MAGVWTRAFCRIVATKYFYKKWIEACISLGIEPLELYGSTRHSSAIALRHFHSPEEIKRGTMHHTNKAFERYFQIENDEVRSVYKNAAPKPINNSINHLVGLIKNWQRKSPPPNRKKATIPIIYMVGAAGFEPATSCSQGRRANQAALRPDPFLGIEDPLPTTWDSFSSRKKVEVEQEKN